MSNSGVLEYPNTVQYPNQNMFVDRIRGYGKYAFLIEICHVRFPFTNPCLPAGVAGKGSLCEFDVNALHLADVAIHHEIMRDTLFAKVSGN